MRRFPALIATAASLALGGTAYAHPKLLSASPSANATVAKPTHIELHFSEKLMPAFSKAELTMAAMPGMAAMKMASVAKLGPDG
ncbi:MAG: copper resistance protein CopC, partial [Sphingomonas sp.]